MLFRFDRKPYSKKYGTIGVNSIDIPFIDSTKFLGVWIDHRLDWNTHTNKLIYKLRSTSKLLSNFKFLPEYSLW